MINFILGFVLGGVVIYFFLEVFLNGDRNKGEILHSAQDDKKIHEMSELEMAKQENLDKTKSYLINHEKITNGEIAKFLGVSDATVVRYFDELEKQGIVRQVGKTGTGTYYEKA